MFKNTPIICFKLNITGFLLLTAHAPISAQQHSGEARDLKLEIPGTPPTVRICISFDFFINNSRIRMGFFWRQFKKKYKNHYLNGFSRKLNNSKFIKDQLVFLPFARQ